MFVLSACRIVQISIKYRHSMISVLQNWATARVAFRLRLKVKVTQANWPTWLHVSPDDDAAVLITLHTWL